MNFPSQITMFLHKSLGKSCTEIFSAKLFPKLLLFATLGYLGNYLRLPLFFGVEFLFGSIFGLIATYLYGIRIGVLVSAIASIHTYILWGHPYAAILLILESLWVGFGLNRENNQKQSPNMVLLVLTYWLCLGAPLCFISYYFSLKFGISSVILVALKQVINGAFNALVASLCLDYLPLRSWLHQKQSDRHHLTIQQVLFNLLVAFVFFPVLTIAILTGYQSLHNIESQINERLYSTTSALSIDLKIWNRDNLRTLQELATLASDDKNTEKNAERLQFATTTLVKVTPSFLSIYTADAQGNILSAFPNIREAERASLNKYIASEELFQKVRDELGVAFSDIHIDQKTLSASVDVAVPILKNDRFNGMVIGSLEIGQLKDFLKEESVTWKIEAFLIDRQKKIISTSSPNLVVGQIFDLQQSAEIANFRSEQVQWIPQIKGISLMSRWRKSYYVQQLAIGEQNPWTLVVRLSPVPFIDALENLYIYILAIVLAIILLATMVANVLSSRLVKPIFKLLRLTNDLRQNFSAESDFAWQSNSFAEIDALGYNFQSMAIALREKFQEIYQANLNLEEKVQDRSAELLKSEERWQLAIQAADDGIWDWNLETGVIFRSDRWRTMLGFEFTGNHEQPIDWLDLIHPDDRDRILETQAAYFAHELPHYIAEYRMRCQDGSYKWILTQATALWNAQDKPIRLVGANHDVTDRKLAVGALQKRETYLAMLVDIQHYLLAESNSDQDYANILEILGKASDFSTIKLFIGDRHIDDHLSFKVHCFWYSSERYQQKESAQIEFVQNIINSPCLERLANGEIINESLLTLPNPESNSEPTLVLESKRAILASKGLCSILVIPIIVNGNLWGFLSFHDYVSDRLRDHDEVSLLTIAASSLAIHLERQQAKMELLQSMESAQAANRTKSEFLATMSHEIRTPMNAVMGFTSLLMDTNLDEEQQEFVDIIRTSGDNLLMIINDILDFSKIESGRFSLDMQAFNLRHCIEECLDLLSSNASAKQIELAYCMAAEVPEWIVSDITRLRQILINLLGNAVKFTPNGEISLRVSATKNHAQNSTVSENTSTRETSYQLLFEIKDTGIGIPQNRFDRLFKPFSQVDSSTTRNYGGTGLGLAIANRLTELMGGKMSVESEVGVGSTFLFTIVTTIAEPEIDSPKYEQSFAGQRLLIVEDNDINREELMIVGQDLKMEVMATNLSEQAIAWLREGNQFDLAIVDAYIPFTHEDQGLRSANGIDALIRDQSKDLPMIVLTSSPKAPNRAISIIDDPITTYLSRPTKRSQLCSTIYKLCSKQFQSQMQSKSKDNSLFDLSFAVKFPLKILLAEDNVVNQKVAMRYLHRLGYRPDVAANGLEVLALMLMQNQTYDVILMDVHMPEMDGIETTKRIMSEFPQSPWIIAVTANALQGDRELCLQAGMQDYVSKPLKIQELIEALETAYTAIKPKK